MGAIALASFVALWISGAVGRDGLWLALLLTPGYYVGMVAGTRLFSRFNDTRFRQFTLVFMMVVALGILIV